MILPIVLCVTSALVCFGFQQPNTQSQSNGVSAGQSENTFIQMCKTTYPDATIITAVNGSCGIICSGYVQRGQYLNLTIFEKDGTTCGDRQRCLTGECFQTKDIQLCMNTIQAPLTAKGCDSIIRSAPSGKTRRKGP